MPLSSGLINKALYPTSNGIGSLYSNLSRSGDDFSSQEILVTLLNLCSIRLYQTSARFQSWDQKQIGNLVHSCHCWSPHAYPLGVTWMSKLHAWDRSMTPRACTVFIASLAALKSQSCSFPKSQATLFWVRWYKGCTSQAQYGIKTFHYPKNLKNSCNCFIFGGEGGSFNLIYNGSRHQLCLTQSNNSQEYDRLFRSLDFVGIDHQSLALEMSQLLRIRVL